MSGLQAGRAVAATQEATVGRAVGHHQPPQSRGGDRKSRHSVDRAWLNGTPGGRDGRGRAPRALAAQNESADSLRVFK